MGNSTVFIWSLVILLLVLIVFRLIRIKNKNSGVTLSETSSRRGRYILPLVIAFIVILIGTMVAKFNLLSKHYACLTAITPEEFCTAIKDSNAVLSLFYDKKFNNNRVEFWRNDGTSYWSYMDTLFNPKWRRGASEGDRILEYAIVNQGTSKWTVYIIKDRAKYNSFFNHLIEIGGDSLHNELYEEGSWLKSTPAYQYQKCIFVRKGFNPVAEGYKMSIITSDSFTLIRH